jgi:phage terminase large subunit-like protein
MTAAIPEILTLDIAGEIERRKRNAIKRYFPDSGPCRRELYVKHLEFFEAGATRRERAFIAGNRVGKTIAGAYETTLHLTGAYPHWWTGRRFSKPVQWWAAGDTSKTVKEILQSALLGEVGEHGTGMIPGHLITHKTAKAGIADAIDTIWVKHVSGKTSTLSFKSYDQRREAFQGTGRDGIWLDEECPQDIYSECVMRTMTTNGIITLTFTPLSGLTEVVLTFLPGGTLAKDGESLKHVTMCGWDDVPHLDETAKRELMASIPAYQREARMKGTPQLGSGAIYPIAEEDLLVDDFELPVHWPRAYGFDVGWNRTAAIWGALDRDTDTLYLYSEHYRGEGEPPVHVTAIKSRGEWIKGVIDPAANGRSQHDGQALIDRYRSMGLDVENADNSVEAGIFEVFTRMTTGRLKIFKSLSSLRSEFRIYRRDDKGKIVKANDHALDALRYLVMSGIERMTTKPVKKNVGNYAGMGSMQGAWMG